MTGSDVTDTDRRTADVEMRREVNAMQREMGDLKGVVSGIASTQNSMSHTLVSIQDALNRNNNKEVNVTGWVGVVIMFIVLLGGNAGLQFVFTDNALRPVNAALERIYIEERSRDQDEVESAYDRGQQDKAIALLRESDESINTNVMVNHDKVFELQSTTSHIQAEVKALREQVRAIDQRGPRNGTGSEAKP